MEFKLNNHTISNKNNSVYFIGEIGINHNGDIDIAKSIMKEAKSAGFSAVKFQKRNPDITTPENVKNIMRETPWGEMSYLEYKHRIEFDKKEYDEINKYSRELEIDWFASCWDSDSLEFITNYDVPCVKIASACITNKKLMQMHVETEKPLIMSTGMSTIEQIKKSYDILSKNELAILHSTSTYPCPPEELNLNMIKTLSDEFPDNPVGYSGHEAGLSTSMAAIALGARILERHITIDRAMWGTDQAASLEPEGMRKLIGGSKSIIKSLGDGVKMVYASEKKSIQNLRPVDDI
jgi:N-acetylneuraminate synthase